MCLWLLAALPALPQSSPQSIAQLMEHAPIQLPAESALRLRQYLLQRIPAPPHPASAAEWTSESAKLRRHLLDNVVFYGWPQEWVNAPLKVEDLGVTASGPGYRVRKLRYEIVPGFFSSAILYEPEKLTANMPAILNLNGHVGPMGKAVEYKQKRCINQARQGILSLNLEWLSYGELDRPGNLHWFAAHLDLAGANGLGIFYLAMRKGLDYLYGHPNVDRTRLGVTGLSGGGWQTIILSALDERVTAAAPVAGFMSLASRIMPLGEVGDVEQNATGLLERTDYPHLVAMLAPRPTLLTYNAEDDCCFRAPLVKARVYDQIRPVFRLFGRENAFAWHENTDPSDHNYQLDNRLQSYRFFTQNFALPVATTEILAATDVRGFDELAVGLPANNLTILQLAQKLAQAIQRPALPVVRQRALLRDTLRLHDVKVANAWPLWNSKRHEVESLSYVFEFDNGLTATGLWVKAIAAPESAPATIILHDKGRKAASEEISDRVNRGEQVLALDLVFTGDSAPVDPGPWAFTQFLAAVGDRPLGIEAAQLAAVTRWFMNASNRPNARLEGTGIRSQVIALVTGAATPGLFSETVTRGGISSLRALLDKPVSYDAAPDLFCLDLYKNFDLDTLKALAAAGR